MFGYHYFNQSIILGLFLAKNELSSQKVQILLSCRDTLLENYKVITYFVHNKVKCLLSTDYRAYLK